MKKGRRHAGFKGFQRAGTRQESHSRNRIALKPGQSKKREAEVGLRKALVEYEPADLPAWIHSSGPNLQAAELVDSLSVQPPLHWH
jgi:hypothetical protein